MPQIIGKSEIRKSYFLNKYIIITPGRTGRPRDIKEEADFSRSEFCVLCPDKIEKDLIIDYFGSRNDWQVMVLKNKFPSVSLNNAKAFGLQEVIIETPLHARGLSQLSVSQYERVFNIYIKRTKAINKNKNIDYVLIFKNSGSKAGASLLHAHSQVFATKILPPDILEELTLAQSYKTEHGSCVYCDIIKKERRSERKFLEDRHVVAFTPYASEYHYEAWLFAKRHIDNITNLSAGEIRSFALALKKILMKLRALNLSYNFFMHQVISNGGQHFHIKIQPRDSVWAGVELGSGLIINSVSPEAAAAYYKK